MAPIVENQSIPSLAHRENNPQTFVKTIFPIPDVEPHQIDPQAQINNVIEDDNSSSSLNQSKNLDLKKTNPSEALMCFQKLRGSPSAVSTPLQVEILEDDINTRIVSFICQLRDYLFEPNF